MMVIIIFFFIGLFFHGMFIYECDANHDGTGLEVPAIVFLRAVEVVLAAQKFHAKAAHVVRHNLNIYLLLALE